MAGRVAIDFGTSNSLLAVWEETRQEVRVPPLAEISRTYDYTLDGRQERVDLVPSLIHYQERGSLIGNQVISRGLVDNGATFRWMKRYLAQRRSLPRQVAGRSIAFPQAARDFLARLLLFAADYCDLAQDEVIFTLPVESFEYYQDWVGTVCDDERVQLRRFRVLDEPTACILGYETPVREGDHVAVVDFGGGTLDVSVVKVDLEAEAARRCTVLGKAGVELGGADIDQWLYEDLLRRNRLTADQARPMSNLLLRECERVKGALSFEQQAELSVFDDRTGKVIAARYVRSGEPGQDGQGPCIFEHLLQERGVFRTLQDTLDRALDLARERGVRKQDIRTALAVGGSTLIPAVRRALEQNFPDRVQAHRPFDAIVRGASRFAAGCFAYDHIQHAYALRHYDSKAKEHRFQTLVKRGANYPSDAPLARLHLNGVFDGQREMRLEVFEVGEVTRRRDTEIVFDANGSALVQPSRGDDASHSHFWMNESNPTFITADPPTRPGERRFRVEFSIDGNKRLLITVLDLKNNRMLYRDFPVVRLQ